MVRIRMNLVEQLLQDVDISVKVIILVRDPRAIMLSRDTMEWCNKASCADVKLMCQDLYADTIHALELGKKYPDRIILIRYTYYLCL